MPFENLRCESTTFLHVHYGTVEVIQPTGDENLDRYLANSAAGRLRQREFGAAVSDPRSRNEAAKKSFWSRLNPF